LKCLRRKKDFFKKSLDLPLTTKELTTTLCVSYSINSNLTNLLFGTVEDKQPTHPQKSATEKQTQQVSELKNLMSENIQALQERGERLEQLDEKSNELAQGASDFLAKVRELNKNYEKKWYEF
jgi:hypothetical protein